MYGVVHRAYASDSTVVRIWISAMRRPGDCVHVSNTADGTSDGSRILHVTAEKARGHDLHSIGFRQFGSAAPIGLRHLICQREPAAMPSQTIMIIRHAEKPDGTSNGIDETDAIDDKSLIPRGWQRAGAWAELFFPSLGRQPALPTPTAILASAPEDHHDAAGDGSKSKRPMQTVSPLAGKLGIVINLQFSKGQENLVAEEASGINGIVLICWQHEDIAAIAQAIVGSSNGVPANWPGDRFNIVLRLDRPNNGAGWTLQQVVPVMLAGDSSATI
jgi:hypothetical protein